MIEIFIKYIILFVIYSIIVHIILRTGFKTGKTEAFEIIGKQKTTSSYYDFSQRRVLSWIIQSLVYRDVSFYYDKKNKAYCRKIKDVKGTVINEKFYPNHHLVNYPQSI